MRLLGIIRSIIDRQKQKKWPLVSHGFLVHTLTSFLETLAMFNMKKTRKIVIGVI